MRRLSFDLYLDRSSLVHRTPATVKLASALALAVVVALAPRAWWSVAIVVAGMLVVMILLSRLPLKTLFIRVLLFEPVVAGVALLSLMQPNGTAVFLSVMTKSTLCLLTMTILAATTRFTDLLQSLRTLRMPALFITTLALMYRYVFLMVDELERMRRARASRTFSRQRLRIWYVLSTMIAQLFVRTSLRAERVYAAMCSRGWQA